MHAVAEEQLFHPLLAQEAGGEQETAECAHDHNEIRHAAAAVEEHEVGSEDWWEAVRTVRQVNADHMSEEMDFFPSFKEAVDDEQRDALETRWLAFHDEHEQADGLSGGDAEVAEVVATEVPEGDPSL